MNNNDYFQIELDKGDYLEAARLAIQFGQGKSSKSGAWAGSSAAVEAAAKGGRRLDTGHYSYPDWERMLKSLA